MIGRTKNEGESQNERGAKGNAMHRSRQDFNAQGGRPMRKQAASLYKLHRK